MIWFSLLIAVAVIVAFVALAGVEPKGTRKVASSGLMTAARVVLALLVVVVAYILSTR